MGSFKTQGEMVTEAYKGIGAGTVYLESSDDKYIIGTKWFSFLKDRIHFVAVSGPEKRGDGGCKEVIRRVVEANKRGLAAYGIVDRDILLGDPAFQDTLWWEVDDTVFCAAKPYGDTIFVLPRWELENYLLYPEALEQLHKDKFRNVPPCRSSQEIAELLIDNEDNFIIASLFSTLHHSLRIPDKKQAHIKHSSNVAGEKLKDIVKTETQCNDSQFNDHRSKIEQFTEAQSDAISRWNRLTRILDGKRTCHRIEELLFHEGAKKIIIEDEMGILASYVANQGLIDPDLTDWLKGVAGRV